MPYFTYEVELNFALAVTTFVAFTEYYPSSIVAKIIVYFQNILVTVTEFIASTIITKIYHHLFHSFLSI